jgi:hypothetical protein
VRHCDYDSETCPPHGCGRLGDGIQDLRMVGGWRSMASAWSASPLRGSAGRAPGGGQGALPTEAEKLWCFRIQTSD